MKQRIRIFIVEYDCVSLITLMLWLDQFSEFEVLGTTVDTGGLQKQVEELKPDVVLLDIETPGPEDIAPLREIKSASPEPGVVLLYHGDPDGLEGVLSQESEDQLGPDRNLGELRDAVEKAYNRIKVKRAVSNFPETRAV